MKTMEELLLSVMKDGDGNYRARCRAEILRRFADLEAENERLKTEIRSWEGSRDGVMQTLDEQEDKVMKAQKKVAELTAYAKKLLDENLSLLNERNAANKKVQELAAELAAAHCDWLAKR